MVSDKSLGRLSAARVRINTESRAEMLIPEATEAAEEQ